MIAAASKTMPLARTTAVRAMAARHMSSAAPKQHRAKDMWKELEATRAPIDADDTHLMFHPPYNFAVTTAMVIGIALTGWGLMSLGVRHQQIKQGYWK